MAHASEPARQDRILDAAEQAFAECGFAGASLREIVRLARVNLATVYYYFRSKEGLAEAVLKRRFGPLRAEHLEMLRAFEAEAQGRPLPVEKILEAMLLPPLRVTVAASAKRQAVTRLIGRIVTEPDTRIQVILRGQRAEVRAAFLKALQASLPEVSTTELRWRMEFIWGALAFILCNPRQLEIETDGSCNPLDPQAVMAEMIKFFAPGFCASGEDKCAKPVKKGAQKVASLDADSGDTRWI
jgi:AcrR family transcriptional regulator